MSRADAPPEVMSVADVMARYGLRDRRAARRLMDEAGAFLVASRLVIRRADLVAHEDRLRSARTVVSALSSAPPRRRPPSRPRRAARPSSDWSADVLAIATQGGRTGPPSSPFRHRV